jgi:hypothetical protein
MQTNRLAIPTAKEVSHYFDLPKPVPSLLLLDDHRGIGYISPGSSFPYSTFSVAKTIPSEVINLEILALLTLRRPSHDPDVVLEPSLVIVLEERITLYITVLANPPNVECT